MSFVFVISHNWPFIWDSFTSMLYWVIPRLQGQQDHPVCSRKEQCHVQDVSVTAQPSDTGDTGDTIHLCWDASKGHHILLLFVCLCCFVLQIASKEMLFTTTFSRSSSSIPIPTSSSLHTCSARSERMVDVVRFLSGTADDGWVWLRHTEHDVTRKPACKQERLGGGLSHFCRKGLWKHFLTASSKICRQPCHPTAPQCSRCHLSFHCSSLSFHLSLLINPWVCSHPCSPVHSLFASILQPSACEECQFYFVHFCLARYSMAKTKYSRRWERDAVAGTTFWSGGKPDIPHGHVYAQQRSVVHPHWIGWRQLVSLEELPNRRSVPFGALKKIADKWWTPWLDSKMLYHKVKKIKADRYSSYFYCSEFIIRN